MLGHEGTHQSEETLCFYRLEFLLQVEKLKKSPVIDFGLFFLQVKRAETVSWHQHVVSTFSEIAFALSSVACYCEHVAVFPSQKEAK